VRWIGAVFQLGIFVGGGLFFLSLRDHSWIMAGIYAGAAFGIYVAMNIRIVTEHEEQ
jgi:hypothetical protein